MTVVAIHVGPRNGESLSPCPRSWPSRARGSRGTAVSTRAELGPARH